MAGGAAVGVEARAASSGGDYLSEYRIANQQGHTRWIIARGQEDGEFRADLDPRMVSYVFYGALEEILTGWVLGQLDDGDEQITAAEQTVIEVVCGGLTPDREAAPL